MTTYQRLFAIVADLLAHLRRSLTTDNVPLDTYGITSILSDRDTDTLAVLFPYNAKRTLECNMMRVEDRTCTSNIRTSDPYSPVPLLTGISLSHSVDAEAQGSTVPVSMTIARRCASAYSRLPEMETWKQSGEALVACVKCKTRSAQQRRRSTDPTETDCGPGPSSAYLAELTERLGLRSTHLQIMLSTWTNAL